MNNLVVKKIIHEKKIKQQTEWKCHTQLAVTAGTILYDIKHNNGNSSLVNKWQGLDAPFPINVHCL